MFLFEKMNSRTKNEWIRSPYILFFFIKSKGSILRSRVVSVVNIVSSK
jgi:hypothetical protein